jgi:hypothetical protein
LFPNPASDEVTVLLSLETSDKVELKVSNLLGQVLISESVFVQENLEKKIDLSGLANGVYIVEVLTGKGSIQRKIVKDRR